MASSSSPTTNSLTYTYRQVYATHPLLNSDKIETRIRSYANIRSDWNGVFNTGPTEAEMADRRFAEEHPELGEVCL